MRFCSILVLLLAMAPVGCRDQEEPASSPESQPAPAADASDEITSQPASRPAAISPFAGYAGSHTCTDCHEEAYEEWKGSHHALAQRDITPEVAGEAFVPGRKIKHGSQTDAVEMRDGRFTVITTDSDGKKAAFQPKGIIGVDPLWQCLIPTERGRWQSTELAFDPAKKEWFNVYTTEDRQYWEWGNWSQRGMNWNSMCATCHTTVFQKNYDPETDGYDSTWLEQGIGCEQCHGPMQAHVEWQEAHPDTEPDPTLPELDRDQYISACGACHARRAELTARFQVGDSFLEHYEPTLPDLSDTFYPDGQIREEDFEYVPFTLSYMYNWGVRCTDCHYWHTGKVATTENELCLRCHEKGISTKRPIDPVEHSHHPPDKAGFKCTDCHMPQTVYMARHWRHDHGMTIPDPLLTKEYAIPNACTRCHDDQSVDWSLQYVQEWYGDLMDRPTRHRARLLAGMKAGDMSAADGVIELLSAETNPNWRAMYIHFLQAVVERSASQEQMAPVLEAMLKCLDDPSPLVQSAAIDVLEPLGPMVTAALTPRLESPHRLVRIKAAWALRRWLDTDTLAAADLMTQLRVRQDQPLGAFQWATFYADRGRHAEAMPWYQRAVDWDRRLSPARHAYATMLLEAGRSREAVDVLVTGSDYEPENALYPYWLGLLYHEIGETRLARDALQTAVELEPRQARMWYNLAMAELQLEHAQAALDAISEAEKLEPDQVHYPYTRATIYYQLGEYELARASLERVLNIDPQNADALGMLQMLQQTR